MRVVLERAARRMEKAPRHPEVNQEYATALEPDNQILAAPTDLRDALALQLGRHLGRLVGPDEPRVVDTHVLEAPTDERALELPAHALDLRQLRHERQRSRVVLARRALGRHDGLPGNPARGCLAAEPGVHRRSDVGELALVDPAGRI